MVRPGSHHPPWPPPPATVTHRGHHSPPPTAVTLTRCHHPPWPSLSHSHQPHPPAPLPHTQAGLGGPRPATASRCVCGGCPDPTLLAPQACTRWLPGGRAVATATAPWLPRPGPCWEASAMVVAGAGGRWLVVAAGSGNRSPGAARLTRCQPRCLTLPAPGTSCHPRCRSTGVQPDPAPWSPLTSGDRRRRSRTGSGATPQPHGPTSGCWLASRAAAAGVCRRHRGRPRSGSPGPATGRHQFCVEPGITKPGGCGNGGSGPAR